MPATNGPTDPTLADLPTTYPPEDDAYELAWADEFDTLSVADASTATANWYSFQPWGGGFSNATFVAPQAGFPFSIQNVMGESVLQIQMKRDTGGNLQSGLISNIFPDGTTKGYRDDDPYAYIEARMMLPDPQAGIWPALWGIETERSEETTTRDHAMEVDVLEHYGAAMPDRYTTVLHDWDWNGTTLAAHASNWIRNVPGPQVMNTDFHTYGVEITPENITFYFDGSAYWRVSMKASGAFTSTFGDMFDTDLAWMMNLAAGGGWPIDAQLGGATMPCKMYIDYFRMYERVAP